jgi:hypothetical protein
VLVLVVGGSAVAVGGGAICIYSFSKEQKAKI